MDELIEILKMDLNFLFRSFQFTEVLSSELKKNKLYIMKKVNSFKVQLMYLILKKNPKKKRVKVFNLEEH
jgi:hypothetical protein